MTTPATEGLPSCLHPAVQALPPSIRTSSQAQELAILRADLLKRYNDAGKRGVLANARKQFCLAQVTGIAAQVPPADPRNFDLAFKHIEESAVIESDAHAERALYQEQLKDVNAQLERLSYVGLESVTMRGMEAATKLAERAVAVDETSAAGFLPAMLSKIARAMTPDLIELGDWTGEPKAIESVDESSTFAGRKVRIKVLVRLL